MADGATAAPCAGAGAPGAGSAGTATAKGKPKKTHAPDYRFFKNIHGVGTGKELKGQCVHCDAEVDMKSDRRQRHLVACTKFAGTHGQDFLSWAEHNSIKLGEGVRTYAGQLLGSVRRGIKRPATDEVGPTDLGGGGGGGLLSGGAGSCVGPLDKHAISTAPLSTKVIEEFQLRWAR